jgi:hypothetical protein
MPENYYTEQSVQLYRRKCTSEIMFVRRGSITIFSIFTVLISLLVSFLIIKVNEVRIKNLQLLKDKMYSQIILHSFLEDLKFMLASCSLNCNSCAYKSKKIFLDGRKKEIRYMGGRIIYYVSDVRSKFLVRAIPENVLFKLFQLKNLPIEKALVARDSLYDWYDPDNVSRVNGAECLYYRNFLKTKYCPRNSRALQSIFELHNIRGFGNFTQDTLERYFTDYSDNTINLNTARKEILELIFNNVEVYDILNKRKAGFCLNSANTVIPPEFQGIVSFFPLKVVEVNVCSSYGEAFTCVKAVIDFSFQDVPFVYLKEFKYLF